MKTFKHDQKLFERVCQQQLGHLFNDYKVEAKEVYAKTKSVREYNLVLSRALSEVGVKYWRDCLDEKKQPKPKRNFTPPQQRNSNLSPSGTKPVRDGGKRISDFL